MGNSERLASFYLYIIRGSILLILFLSLLVVTDFFFPFVFPRTVVFRVLVEASLVALLGLILIKPYFRPSWSLPTAAVTAFLGILAITAVLGVNPYHSFWSSVERSEGVLLWIHLYGFFILLVSVLKTRSEWVSLFRAATVAGWLQVLYSLGQYLDLPFAIQSTGERIHGSIGNPTFLASYLIFIIGISCWLYLEDTHQRWRMSYLPLVLCSVFIIWQTQTRGAILALVVFAVVVLMNVLWSKLPRTVALAGTAATIVILIIGGALIPKVIQPLGSEGTLRRLASISSADITVQNRLIVWDVGFNSFWARPLTGWGWENFRVPFNEYFNPDIARDIGSNPWYDRAHNMIIEVVVATGLIGLALYLGLLGIALYCTVAKKRGVQRRATCGVLAATVIAYIIQNLFVFDTLNSYIMFFLLLGFLQLRSYTDETEVMQSTTSPLFHATTHGMVMVLPLLIISGALYFLNVRPSFANYYMAEAIRTYGDTPDMARQYFQKAFEYSPPNDEEYRFSLIQYTRDQIRRRRLTDEVTALVHFATDEGTKTIEASPEVVQTYVLLAELYLDAVELDPRFNLERAEQIALNALTRAPKRYQIYTLLGRINISQNKPEEAIQYFTQAIDLNDQFAESYWNLAIAYILSHQFDKATEALNRTREVGTKTGAFNIDEEKNIDHLFQAYLDARNPQAMRMFLQDLVERFPENKKYRDALDSFNDLLTTLPAPAE